MRDRWLQAFALWLPTALILLFVAIFWSGSPKDLPVYVVDHDNSALGRTLTRHLDANPEVMVAERSGSMVEGKRALVNGSHYALIVIPANFERDTALGRSPAITVFINAQYLLVAKAMRSAIVEIEMIMAGEIAAMRALAETKVVSLAASVAEPIRIETSGLYNSNLNYAQFLIPGISFALLQILISSVTILTVSREFKWGGEEYWLGAGLHACLAAKLLPYTGLFTLHCLLALALFFGALDWPHHASVTGLLPFVLLFVVACQMLGLFFFALTKNPERALGFAGGFSAPAFAFLGLTFPASDMSVFSQFWRDLMPAAHITDAYILRSAYGASIGAMGMPALALTLTLLLLPWSARRIGNEIRDARA